MGIVSTITAALTDESASTESESSGAYWCDDCDVRVRDVAVESRGLDRDDEGTPRCPDCGSSMRFERSHAAGCAC